MNYSNDTPQILRSFLTYHETSMGHSKKTVDEYYLDLRLYFRFLKIRKGLVPYDTPMEDIPIADVTIDLIADTSLTDVYDYLSYLARDRERNGKSGLSATSRARKTASLRSFYKYLTNKAHLLSENPLAELDSPKIIKTLPRYLTLEDSKKLLSAVDGRNRERDFAILMLFLTCGLRISELTGLNIGDISGDRLRVLGKGNKERIVYLSASCLHALDDYLNLRRNIRGGDERALFLSSRKDRISRSTVHSLVKKYLTSAGLDSSKYSSHKLRHTAATLMLHSGVDVRTLQEVLGHEHLNTTEIYTHIENQDLRDAARLSPLADFEQDE